MAEMKMEAEQVQASDQTFNPGGNEGMNREIGIDKSAKGHQPQLFGQVGFLALFEERYLLATLLAIGIQVVQQWSGINAVMFYSSRMFKDANVPGPLIQYAVCATGLIIMLITIVSVNSLILLNLFNLIK